MPSFSLKMKWLQPLPSLQVLDREYISKYYEESSEVKFATKLLKNLMIPNLSLQFNFKNFFSSEIWFFCLEDT